MRRALPSARSRALNDVVRRANATGNERIDEAWKQGRALTFDEAVALALDS